jgi:hypothetical protein
MNLSKILEKRPGNKIAAAAVITTATTTATTAATITATTAATMTTATAMKEEAEKQEEPQKEVVENCHLKQKSC